MTEVQPPKQRWRRWGRIILLSTALALCLVAFAVVLFHQAVDYFFARPIETIGDWIGRIEFEDRGGDYRITIPPIGADTPQPPD